MCLCALSRLIHVLYVSSLEVQVQEHTKSRSFERSSSFVVWYLCRLDTVWFGKFVRIVVQNMISVNECDSPMTASGQFDVENKYDLVMIKDSEIQKATETTHGTVPAVVTPAPASPVEETSRPHDLELDADVQEKSNHVKITVSRIKRA